jgi:hypothetical protein
LITISVSNEVNSYTSEFPLAVSQKILYEEGHHAHKSFSGALSPLLFWGLLFGSRLVPGLTGKKEL